LRDASASENTRRAYLSDWRRWDTWCAERGYASVPAHPDTVCAYLADQAERVKVSTLARHLATISKAHQVAGVANPCQSVAVRDTLRGLRRTRGTARSEAPALVAPDLRATLDALPDTLAGVRGMVRGVAPERGRRDHLGRPGARRRGCGGDSDTFQNGPGGGR